MKSSARKLYVLLSCTVAGVCLLSACGGTSNETRQASDAVASAQAEISKAKASSESASSASPSTSAALGISPSSSDHTPSGHAQPVEPEKTASAAQTPSSSPAAASAAASGATPSTKASTASPQQNETGTIDLGFGTIQEVTTIENDGAWEARSAQGTTVQVDDDGSWYVNGTKGILAVDSDGSWTWTSHPSGGMVTVERNGSWTWTGGPYGIAEMKVDGSYSATSGGKPQTPAKPAAIGKPSNEKAAAPAVPATPKQLK